MTLEEEIGQRVWRLRKRSGMSQRVLGDRMGELLARTWSRQAVWAAERGERSFTAAEMVAFAEVFGVSIADMFVGEFQLCVICSDNPPAGFTCNECGAVGQREAS